MTEELIENDEGRRLVGEGRETTCLVSGRLRAGGCAFDPLMDAIKACVEDTLAAGERLKKLLE